MKTARVLLVCSAVLAPAAMAQRWEVGGGAGGGFYTSQDVSLAGSSVSAKIDSNASGSVWLDNNGLNHWGGELRSDYQLGDLAPQRRRLVRKSSRRRSYALSLRRDVALHAQRVEDPPVCRARRGHQGLPGHRRAGRLSAAQPVRAVEPALRI